MYVTDMPEYGLGCMVQHASHQPKTPLAVREIARRERLTPVYVEKILVNLRRSGLVKSLRGVNGGYIMAKPPKDISVGTILSALGQVDLGRNICNRFTGESTTCVHAGQCSLRPIWGLLTRYIFSFLDQISLEQLLQDESRVIEDINRLGSRPPQGMTATV